MKLVLSALAIWAALPILPADKKTRAAEAEIRSAMEDSSKVLVITESDDYWAVFPVTGISAVAGDTVTVEAGTFAIADCRKGTGPPESMAKQLLEKWKSRKGENRIVVSSPDGTYTLAFSFGALEGNRTFRVKKVVLVGSSK